MFSTLHRLMACWVDRHINRSGRKQMPVIISKKKLFTGVVQLNCNWSFSRDSQKNLHNRILFSEIVLYQCFFAKNFDKVFLQPLWNSYQSSKTWRCNVSTDQELFPKMAVPDILAKSLKIYLRRRLFYIKIMRKFL